MASHSSDRGSAWHRAVAQAMAFNPQWLHPFQIFLAVVLLSAVGWVHTFNLIEADRTEVLAKARNDIENLGRVNQEHAESTFASLDQLLKMLRWQYLDRAGQLDFQALPGKGFFDTRLITNIAVLDAKGILKLSVQPFTGHRDFSVHEHFKAHQAPGSDALYISDVVMGRISKRAVVQLARRITLNNGEFGGVIVVSIDPTYFTRFYGELKLGNNGVAALIKPNGALLARKNGALDEFIGRQPFSEVNDRIELGNPTGTFMFRSELDQVERIFHFRRAPGFPVILTLSVETHEVLAAHQVTRAILLRQASIVTALLLLIGVFMSWYGFARQKIEHSHRSELDQLKALTNRAAGMIFQYVEQADGSARFTFVSDGVFDIFGLSTQAVLADAGLVFGLVHPDDIDHVQASMAQSAHELSPWHQEVRICLADGSVRWVSGKSLPHRRDDGSTQWDGYLSDITDHKRVEAAALAASQAKSDFLSSMSHEIRSPLNAILGLAYLLEQAALNPDALDMVQKIRASGRLLLGLISDILDVSKIEASQMVIEQAPFRLSDVMDSVAVILGVAVGEKDIKLIILPPPPGVYTLMGDVLRLEQVLLNLGINAIKFTSVGQVEVSCELLASHTNKVSLRFCVRDTGIGIDPELQRGVFDAFTQADNSTTRRFGGTGLGLTICRQLVELMGGEIGMTSVPDLGSQFWFTLPLDKVEDGAISAGEPNTLNALIVDDSNICLQYVNQVATGLGWHVRSFDSSDSVLSHLLTCKDLEMPDVVLLDWKMPVLDGLATVRLIREQFAPEKCPLLIIMTNHSLASLIRAEGIERVDALLEKPVTASSLHHAVLEARRKRAATGRISLATGLVPTYPLQGIRVLVVDDSEINCEVARRILHGAGAVVALANNGQEALDWLQTHPNAVDLVLMDVQMPVMGGMEATRQLRLMPQFANLPIVALTAGAFKSQQEAAHAAGMTHFISKPFDVPSTIALIQRLTFSAPLDAVSTALDDIDSLNARKEINFCSLFELPGDINMTTTAIAGLQKSVLIVDDDEFSRALVRKTLELLGVTGIQEAADGRAGVQALAQMPKLPDFLICDVFMPDMDGIEFVGELAKQRYQGGLVLVTGVSQSMLEVASDIAIAKGLRVLGTLTKPVSQASLEKALGMTAM